MYLKSRNARGPSEDHRALLVDLGPGLSNIQRPGRLRVPTFTPSPQSWALNDLEDTFIGKSGVWGRLQANALQGHVLRAGTVDDPGFRAAATFVDSRFGCFEACHMVVGIVRGQALESLKQLTPV